jgi:hypothetical protein
MRLRYEVIKNEGMTHIEEKDLYNSYNINKEQEFIFAEIDLDETRIDKILIISANDKFYQLWHFIEIFNCITSSYFYAYAGTYELPPPGDWFFTLMLFYEIFFLFSIGFKFILEIKTSENAIPIRNHKLIAERYLTGEFPLDIITLVPAAYMIHTEGHLEKHLQMLKIFRIYRGFKIFDIQKIMQIFKHYYRDKLD